MATIAETPVMEFAAEAPALEPEAAVEEQLVEEQPVEAAEMPMVEAQYVVPTSFVHAYSAAPVTYIAAPTMMAPPPTVAHYTWNGEQYPSMEAAMNAMMAEAQSKLAAAPEVEEPKEEPKEELNGEPVKKRDVKPRKGGCC